MPYTSSRNRKFDAKTVTSSIAQVESGNDPSAQGASGEYGAFQFMPSTWKSISKEQTGQVLEQNAQNERRVAESKVQSLLDRGHSAREVALIWNTSLGGKEEPLEISGTNDKGVDYDSGAYADKVLNAAINNRTKQLRKNRVNQKRSNARTQRGLERGIQSDPLLRQILGESDTGRATSESLAPERNFDTLLDVGEGISNIGASGIRAALNPTETSLAIGENIDIGVGQAKAAVNSGTARVLDIATDAGTAIIESPYQLAEKIIGSDVYQAPDFESDFVNTTENILDSMADENMAGVQEQSKDYQEEFGVDPNATLKEKLEDPNYVWGQLMARNAPNLAVSAGAGLVGGPGAALATGGVLEGGFAVNEAKQYLRENDMEDLAENDKFLNNLFLPMSIIGGSLEATGAMGLLDANPLGKSIKRSMMRNIVRDVTKSTVEESSTETMQEIVANVVGRTYNKNRDYFEGAAEAAIAGGLTGGGGSVVSSAVNELNRPKYRDLMANDERGFFDPSFLTSDRADQTYTKPENAQDAREVMNKLEQNSQGANQQDITRLKTYYDELVQQEEETGGKELRQYANQNGVLREDAREDVQEMGYDNLRDAQNTYDRYQQVRTRRLAMDNALTEKSFSPKQVIQRVESAKRRTRTELESQQARQVREAIRDRDSSNSDIISGFRQYAREFLPASERGTVDTRIQNILDASRDETRGKRLTEAMDEVQQKYYEYRKSELRNQIKGKLSTYADSAQVAPQMRERLQNVLNDIDLQGMTDRTRQRLQNTLEFAERQIEEDGSTQVPAKVLEETNRLAKTRWEDLSAQQLEDKLAEIQRLIDQGKSKRRAQESVYENQKRETKESLLADNADLTTKEIPGQESYKEKTQLRKVQDYIKNKVIAAQNKLSSLDKAVLPTRALLDLLGEGHARIGRLINTRSTEYLQDVKRLEQEVNDILNQYDFTDAELRQITIKAYEQQEGGRQRLVDNNNIPEEDINNITLNEQQQELLDKALEVLNRQYPGVERTAREVGNENVEKVENYLPFITDLSQMSDQEMKQEMGRSDIGPMIDPNESTGRSGRNTKRVEEGMTKSRQAQSDLPLELDFAKVFQRGVRQNAYYTHMARPVRQAYEAVNSDEYAESNGDLAQKMMKDWLSVVATNGGYKNDTRMNWLDKIRQGSTIGALGINVGVALVQTTAYLDGMRFLGVKDMNHGMKEVTMSKAARDFADKMPEIERRTGGETALQEAENAGGSIQEKAAKAAFFVTTKVDSYYAKGAAVGAYRQWAQKKADNLSNPQEELNIDGVIVNESGKVQIDYSVDPDIEGIVYAQEQVEASMSNNEAKNEPLATSAAGITGNKSVDNALLQFMSVMLRRWGEIRSDIIDQGFMKEDSGTTKLQASARMAAIFLTLAAETGLFVMKDSLLSGEDDEEPNVPAEFAKNVIQTVPLVGSLPSIFMYGSMPVPALSFANGAAQSIGRGNGAEAFTQLMGMAGVPGMLTYGDEISDYIKSEAGGGSSSGGLGGGLNSGGSGLGGGL